MDKPTITYAIGDIHGCNAALEAAFAWIAEDANKHDFIRVVTMGDYVDRGPDSRKVLANLMGAQNAANNDLAHRHPERFKCRTEIICLSGNHEVMMSQAMHPDTQDQMLKLWLLNGGDKTLENYIHTGAIEQEVMTKHLDWIRGLPVYYEDEHRIYVHAGLVTAFGSFVHPSEAVHEPSHRRAMQWMFTKPSQMDYTMVPKTVVVGHVAVHNPIMRNNGIMIDTGAGMGGDLTVARFGDGPDSTHVTFKHFPTE